LAAFFPRYLFVRLDLGRDQWRSVNGTFGVASLIMEGDRPKAVPSGVVEGLATLADAAGVISLEPVIGPGERVRILRGPFADHVGTMVRVDQQRRVQILLELMGAAVLVRSDRWAIAPAA
jgi:transcription antitermination factor NusG